LILKDKLILRRPLPLVVAELEELKERSKLEKPRTVAAVEVMMNDDE